MSVETLVWISEDLEGRFKLSPSVNLPAGHLVGVTGGEMHVGEWPQTGSFLLELACL